VADVELFDVASIHTQKVSAVPIGANLPGAPQTVVSLVTPSLPAGVYNVAYAWQATFLAKDRPLFFKAGGTFADAQFFSEGAGVNNALRINKLYGYPKNHGGGPITFSLEMYDPLKEAVVDFADVVVTRVG
jgi:hypothetical protein